MVDFYSQTSPFPFSHYLPRSHAFNPNPEAMVLLLLFFYSFWAAQQACGGGRQKTENFSMWASSCQPVSAISLWSTPPPTNPHRSTIYPPNAKNGKKTHNTRWSLPLKTKILNTRTIQGEHKEEYYCRATSQEDMDA